MNVSMNANKIQDLLERLINGDKFKNCIMIDGAWGIGKTYQINSFIIKHKNRKNLKVIYQSLAGKNSVEDIHSSLYSKMHPNAKVMNIIASALSVSVSQLIEKTGTNVNASVAVDNIFQELKNKPEEGKAIKKSKKNTYLIIFDDLERAGFDFRYDLFLGYLNQLVLSGFKVCVVCNAAEISNVTETTREGKVLEEFKKFKEKAFDREYKIDEFDMDAVSLFLKRHGIQFRINENTLRLFDNNLRLANKILSFYRDVKAYLSKLSQDEYHHPKDEIVLWYCSMLLRWITGSAKTNDYRQRLDSIEKNLFIIETIEEHFQDKTIIEEIQCAIYQDIDENDSNYKDAIISMHRSEFITSLALAYFNEDYANLGNCLRTQTKETIFGEKPIFYRSKEGKEEYIKKSLEYLADDKNEFSAASAGLIASIFKYKHLFPADFDEDDFVKRLANKIDNRKSFEQLLQPNNCAELTEFAKKLEKAFQETERNRITNELHEKIRSSNVYDLFLYLEKLRETLSINEEMRTLIIKDFLNNALYLSNLDGELSESDWNKCEDIVSFLSSIDKQKECAPFLSKKCEEAVNETSKERFKMLIDVYNFKHL